MDKFEILQNLLKSDRSVRRFDETKEIKKDTLLELVELTRFCASGRNLQPLRYKIISDKMECGNIFPLLGWAGYLTDWDGPQEGERPTAYLIQGLDTRLTNNCLCDDGIQLQAITLGITAKGLGACIIKSFNQKKLIEIVKLPEWFVPTYIIAIGVPKEEVVIENLDSNDANGIKYFRTQDKIHHVPKRTIDQLII